MPAVVVDSQLEREAPARRFHVAHVGSDPNVPGGMPTMLRELLASPLGDMHDLEAIPTFRTRGKVDRLLVFLAGLARLAGWCLRPGTRIVHVHTAVRGSWYRKAVVVALVKGLRRPVILHLHVGTWDIAEFDKRIGPIRRRVFRWLFGTADLVLSVSSDGARELERRFGRESVIVIPNAAPRFTELDEDRSPDAGSPPQVLYVGGFRDPAKGGQVLLQALPALLERRPDLQLTLAGEGQLPREAEELLAKHAGVRWVGWMDQQAKREAFSRADLFVLPSVSEGLPMALLEAMSYGKAIVATKMGGVPDVMDDDAEGVLVPPGDAGALVEAIHALAADPVRRARLSAGARERSRRFTPEAVSEQLDAVYQLVAGR